MACTSCICLEYITACASNAQNNIHVGIQPVMDVSAGKTVCPQYPVMATMLAGLTCVTQAKTQQPHSKECDVSV